MATSSFTPTQATVGLILAVIVPIVLVTILRKITGKPWRITGSEDYLAYQRRRIRNRLVGDASAGIGILAVMVFYPLSCQLGYNTAPFGLSSDTMNLIIFIGVALITFLVIHAFATRGR